MEASDASVSLSETNKNHYYVYVLYSLKDCNFYVGYSRDIKKRIHQHTNGEVISTKYRRPFKLLHYEYFVNETDAKARERFYKSGFGRQQLKAALKRTLESF